MILTSLLIYHVNKYLSNNNKKKIMLLCAICTNVLIFYIYIISFFVDKKYQNVCEKIRP